MKGAGQGHVWNGAGICTDRGVVNVEGTQDVAFSDGIGHRAIGSLILIQGLHSDQSGVECGGTFVEGHLVQLLPKGGSVVVLIQDGDIHRGGGLWDTGHHIKHCGGICWAVSGTGWERLDLSRSMINIGSTVPRDTECRAPNEMSRGCRRASR